MDEDSTITIDVLGNDYDPDGGTLSLSGVLQPNHGTTTANGDMIDYIPDADYYGTDTFIYAISDGQGSTSTGTVTVTINDVPEPTPTPLPGAGEVSILPDTITVDIDDSFTLGIYVDTGNQMITSYNIDISYNDSVLQLDTTQDPDGVAAGADGFVSTVDTSTAGVINVQGSDVSGHGPEGYIHMITLYFTALNSGYSPIDLTINALEDESGYTVGIPATVPGTVNILTPEPTPTPMPGAGNVWVEPDTLNVVQDNDFSLDIYVDSGAQKVAAYGIDIIYDATILQVEEGSSGVEPGADGFISAVNATEPGIIIVSGFDTSGIGPSTELHLLTAFFTPINAGTSAIDLTVKNLVDEATNEVGYPNGIGGTVFVSATPDPTPEPTPQPTPVPSPAGQIWVEPGYQEVMWTPVPFTTDIWLSTGTTQLLVDYALTVTWDNGIITPDTAVGDNGVTVGPDGFILSVNAVIDSGYITVSGYDATGRGPGELHVFTITWQPQFLGDATVEIVIGKIFDETGTTIGTPNTVNGIVHVY